jgi:hypothetical protein
VRLLDARLYYPYFQASLPFLPQRSQSGRDHLNLLRLGLTGVAWPVGVLARATPLGGESVSPAGRAAPTSSLLSIYRTSRCITPFAFMYWFLLTAVLVLLRAFALAQPAQLPCDCPLLLQEARQKVSTIYAGFEKT